MITDDDMLKALDRIARTLDGALLYRYLQKELLGVLEVPPGDPNGALISDHGRRKFAAKLMAAMRQGIEDSGGRTADDARPIVFAVQQRAIADHRSRGAGRRVQPDDDKPTGFPGSGAD